MTVQALIDLIDAEFGKDTIDQIVSAGHELHRAQNRVFNATYTSGPGGDPGWNVEFYEIWDAALEIQKRQKEDDGGYTPEYRKSLEDEAMKEVHERGQ